MIFAICRGALRRIGLAERMRSGSTGPLLTSLWRAALDSALSSEDKTGDAQGWRSQRPMPPREGRVANGRGSAMRTD